MKVLLVTTSRNGGAGIACLRLLKALNFLKVDSDILDYEQILHQSNFYQRIIFRLWFLYQKLFCKIFFLEAYESVYSPIKLSKWVKDYRIINLHWTSRILDYSSFFTNLKVPLVWTLHDMQAFSGGYPYESSNHSILGFLFRRNIRIKKSLLKNKSIHIVCPSNWLCSLSERSHLFSGFPHHVINNGINTEVFTYKDKQASRKKLNISESEKLILFVSQSISSKRKGIALLMETFNDDYFKSVKLLALGQCDSRSYPSANIDFTGYISDKSILADYYNAADLFVIASLEDNLPNTILESLCCGTPVVGFNIGGIPELIQDGSNGIISRELTVEGLRKAIIMAMSVNWDKLSISQNAKPKYSLEMQARNYNRLFDSILSTDR